MKKTLLFVMLAACTVAETAAQVTQLANNEGLQLLAMLNGNKAIFYSRKTTKLWVSNGTAAGTLAFTNKVSIPDIPSAAVMNGVLYFSGTDMAGGTELWATDGTDAGTRMVKDIYPGGISSAPDDGFVLFNNRIYFSAATPDHGREIWSSDGTQTGTVMVKDIVAGTGSSNLRGTYKVKLAGNFIYFVCSTPLEGEELWRTDGTAGGTLLLKDIKTATLSSSPVPLEAYNGKLIFNADDLIHGREPWITDGTPSGTVMIKDIATGPMSSSPENFIAFNNNLLFVATDLEHGQELWKTNGTEAGTALVKDIQPGDWGSAPLLVNAVRANNKLFFAAYSNTAGMELWQTDGTAAGTQLFVDIEPGEGDAIPILLPAYANGFGTGAGELFQGNKFFFGAFNTATGYELYISDGTVAGTRLIKNLDNTEDDGLTLHGYYISNTGIYFSGNDGTHKGELFKSDGTTAGTGLAASVNTAGTDAETMPFVLINGALLFFGNDGNNPSEELNDLYRLNVNDIVLPVNIIAFAGVNEGGKNILSWKAANGTGLNRFVVERSTDGSNFSEAGTVTWRGDGNYTFTDITNISPLCWYRLRLIDRDNSVRYSNTIVLRKSSNGATDFKVTRNEGTISVMYAAVDKISYITVTDISGRSLYRSRISGNNGSISIFVPALAGQPIVVSIHTAGNTISKTVF